MLRESGLSAAGFHGLHERKVSLCGRCWPEKTHTNWTVYTGYFYSRKIVQVSILIPIATMCFHSSCSLVLGNDKLLCKLIYIICCLCRLHSFLENKYIIISFLVFQIICKGRQERCCLFRCLGRYFIMNWLHLFVHSAFWAHLISARQKHEFLIIICSKLWTRQTFILLNVGPLTSFQILRYDWIMNIVYFWRHSSKQNS